MKTFNIWKMSQIFWIFFQANRMLRRMLKFWFQVLCGSQIRITDTTFIIMTFCSENSEISKIHSEIFSNFQNFGQFLYLPHMEYEGSIGLVTGKIENFYC
jgi:hypothetical protein